MARARLGLLVLEFCFFPHFFLHHHPHQAAAVCVRFAFEICLIGWRALAWWCEEILRIFSFHFFRRSTHYLSFRTIFLFIQAASRAPDMSGLDFHWFARYVLFLFYNRARWETEQLKISRIFDVVVCLINPSDRRATSLISFSRTYWFRLWRRRESCSFNWKGQWISSALINDLSLRLIFYL